MLSKSASFRQADAESDIAFSKKDETVQESQGILSPLRLPVAPRRRFDFHGIVPTRLKRFPKSLRWQADLHRSGGQVPLVAHAIPRIVTKLLADKKTWLAATVA
jgi:hypothetical protein